MPRKAKGSSLDEAYLFSLMRKALVVPEEKRCAAISDWCAGNYKPVARLAHRYEVTRAGVLLLTLLELAHPLLVAGKKIRGGLVWCSIRLLEFELHKESTVAPLYTPPVYNAEVIHSVHRSSTEN